MNLEMKIRKTIRTLIRENVILESDINLDVFPPNSYLSKDKKGVMTPFVNKKYEIKMFFKFTPEGDGSYRVQQYESWGGSLNEKGSEKTFPNLPKSISFAKKQFKDKIDMEKGNYERSQQYKFRDR